MQVAMSATATKKTAVPSKAAAFLNLQLRLAGGDRAALLP
jgi:hypothetical protein